MAGRRLSPEVRRRVIRLAARGKTYREIIDEAGVSMGFVTLVTKPLGGVTRPEMWTPSPARLSLDDRVNIKLSLEAGESFAEIARRLGRATSTISREVGGVPGRGRVRADRKAPSGVWAGPTPEDDPAGSEPDVVPAGHRGPAAVVVS